MRRGATPQGSHTARLEREREFHDICWATDGRQEVQRFYAIADEAHAYFREQLTKHGAKAGTQVLELGCGPQFAAAAIAEAGIHLTAIDISPVAVEQARKRAEAEGMSVSLEVANAETTPFADASFDLICGKAILHHLNLPAAIQEARRLLRPQGTIIFFEPLGHNPLIELYRRLTPQLRTPDEHPLKVSDFKLARERFRLVDVTYFCLTSLLAIPFPSWRMLRRSLQRLDCAIFRWFPFLRRYAWFVVLVLREPRN